MTESNDHVRRPFIDAHAHLFPDRLMAAIFRAFRRDGYALCHEGDAATVAQGLLDGGADYLFLLAYAHKGGVAPGLNAWLHQVAAAEPRFVPFGAAHPDDEDFPGDVIRALDDYRFAGIKLHCSVQRLPCDDPRLDPLYAHVQERGKAVVIHAGTAPYEDAFTGIEQARRLVRRFPDLTVVFAHMGLWDMHGFGELARQHPRVFLDCSSVLAYPRFVQDPRFAGWQTELPALLTSVADKVLWGSDYPYLETPYDTPLQALDQLGLADDVVQRIRYDNARQLLARIWADALPLDGGARRSG